MCLCICCFPCSLGTQSKAAVNLGVKQTGAGSSYVDLAWNAQLGAGHYHTQFSQDGKKLDRYGIQFITK